MCQYITSDHVDLYMEESTVSDLQFAFHRMIVYHDGVCSTVANVSLQALISSIDFFGLVSANTDKHGQCEGRKQESANE